MCINCDQQLPIGPTGSNGINGDNGSDGANGINGTGFTISTTDERPGANCTYGGIAIQIGIDNNGDGNPDALLPLVYVCNGAPGADSFPLSGMVFAMRTTFTGAGNTDWDSTGLGIGTTTTGYAICNGNNGTLDMQSQTIFGASLTDPDFIYSSQLGNNSIPILASNLPHHTHPPGTLTTNSTGAHTHAISSIRWSTTNGFDDNSGSGDGTTGAFTPSTDSAGTHSHSVSSGATGNNVSAEDDLVIVPKFTALWWVQKL